MSISRLLQMVGTNEVTPVETQGWNLSTAIYNQAFINVAAQDTSPTDVALSADGTLMYMLGSTSDSLYQYKLQTPWDVKTASPYLFNVSAQETTPEGVAFSTNGTKMYVVGSTSDSVYQYSLSTAWDLTTVTYDSISFSVIAQDNSPTGIAFKSDGTKMYITGISSDRVHQYSLATPWDISTAAYDGLSLSVSSQDATPRGITFKSDGLELYMIGSSTDTVYQYTLSEAWDITTANYQGLSFALGKQDTEPRGVKFNHDGSTMYVIGQTNDSIHQYRLVTPWDVSSAVFLSFDVSEQESLPQSVSFSTDGTKMYIVGTNTDTIYQYSLSTPWSLTSASYDNISLNVSSQDATPQSVSFNDDGTLLFMSGSTSDSVYRYTLTTAWDLSTAYYLQNVSVAGEELAPTGVTFSTDGTKMYVIGTSVGLVHQYTLSMPWNSLTAVYDGVSFSVANQDSSPQSIIFRGDGTMMFIVGATSDKVYRYTLSTPWDIATASYVQNFNISAQETTPTSVFFKPDGTKMYVIGTTGDAVNEYDLSVAWKISTAVYARNFSVAGQEATPTSVIFKSDGTKMYVVGSTSDSIHQYSLSTAWDVSSASYDVKALDVARQDNFPQSISFNQDGSILYMIGSTSDSVYQYSLGTEWDISTAVYYANNFSVAIEELTPSEVTFSSDGTKMYVVGTIGYDINEYALSTAWNISTAVYQQSFIVFAQELTPTAVAFKTDGTKMYVTGTTSKRVHQYTLGTSWDVTSATYDGVSFNLTDRELTPQTLTFDPQGAIMYVAGDTADTVYQYTLSIPWDVSTAAIFSQNFSIVTQEGTPTEITFNTDGTIIYVIGSGTDKIHQYALSTPWRVSTAVYVQTIAVNTQDSFPVGVSFKSDGTKMYVLGATTDSVYQYSLKRPWNVSSATYDNVSLHIARQDVNPTSISFNDTGSTMYIIGSTSDTVHQFSLSTAWDLSSAVYDAQAFSVALEELTPTGIAFKPDGTKVYVIGATGDDINEYVLSTPWKVSTANYAHTFSVAGQETTPTGLAFSTNGTKLYVVGSTSDTVYQYSLSTAWDISTAVYDSISISVLSQDNTPDGITFKTDGTIMYIVGSGSDRVYQYNLTTPWDISTASFAHFFSVGSEDSVPTGLAFNDAGSIMYVLGATGDDVNQYSLATAWDISTASYIQNFSVISEDNSPQDIAFATDGTKVYMVGSSTDTIYQYELATAWDISSAYHAPNLKVSGQEGTPTGLTFKTDGTKLYVVGSSSDSVHQYSLTTPWDSTTASYDGIAFNMSAQAATPEAVLFSSDGTSLYTVDSATDAIYQYTLSSAWDITSASYIPDLVLSAQDAAPTGLVFKSDGTKMYVIGSGSDKVHQYSLSTAWNVLTASYDSVTLSIVAQDNTPQSLAFNDDGTILYILGSATDTVYQYALTTPWDITTASYLANPKVSAQEATPTGIAFKSDGTKMYVIGSSSDRVHQYSLSTAWDSLTASYDGISLLVSPQDTTPESIVFSTDGSMLHIVGSTSDTVYQYVLSSAWDLSTASYSEDISIVTQDATPVAVSFSYDGTKMYMLGDTGDAVSEYSLSIAWKISTAVYVQNLNIASQDVTPRGLAFKPDGTKMYIVGSTNKSVYQYTLITPWDITTALYESILLNVSSEDATPENLVFGNNGTELYIIGSTSDTVYQYPMTTAWDITTATYTQNFNVAAQEVTPSEATFSTDGTKMYIIGSTGDDVNEYDLGVAWKISTATYLQNFVISAQDSVPTSITFKPDGTKMYVLGSSNDAVHQYTLTTAWDISSATYDRILLSVRVQDITPTGLFFKPDGTSLYIIGEGVDSIHQYSLGVPWNLTSAESSSIGVLKQDNSPTDLAFSDDGSIMYVIGSGSDSVHQYTLNTPWDLKTARPFVLDVSAQDTTPQAVAFSTDGTKMYMVGDINNSIYQYALSTPWVISTAVYDNISFSVSAQDSVPTGISFKPDGTKMYVAGATSDRIHQYSLSTVWDLSTATYDDISIRVATQETAVQSVAFNDDGTKMFILGTGSDAILQYTLTTAWDVATAVYDNVLFNVSVQETSPTGMFFRPTGTNVYIVGSISDTIFGFDIINPWDVATVDNSFLSLVDLDTAPQNIRFSTDGTKMYMLGATSRRLYQYSVQTPWNFSTSTYDEISFLFSGQDSIPKDIYFKPDGTKLYMLGDSADDIYQYSLSTPWDISTMSYDSISYDLTSLGIPNPIGLYFKPDGLRMFVVSSGTDRVHQFDVSTAWDLSNVKYNSFVVNSQETAVQGIAFKSDGTKMYIIGSGSDSIYQYTLGTSWDISTASYDSVSLSVAAQDNTPTDLSFSSDGKSMYMVGSGSDKVNQYTLITAWDISTAYYQQNVLVSSQETTPTGLTFSTDGTKLYVIGTGTDTVYQYSLGIPWSTLSATYTGLFFSVATQDTTPEGVTFNDDGTLMFIVGSTSDSVYRYSLSTPWDVSTASYLQNFSVATQELTPSEVVFSTDGTKMYVLGTTGDDINEYSLSVAWKLSTATYIHNFSVAGQDTFPTGIAFKPDGTKMYVVGTTTDRVHQYTLGTAWDISSATYDNISFLVSGQDGTPESVTFSVDGTSMFIIGSTSDRVHGYTLTTAWDISSAYYNKKFAVSAQEANPCGLYFKPDGTKMYVTGYSGDDVNEYDLTVPWEVTSASYVQQFVVGGQETVPTGITFKPDGSIMYLIGSTGDDINQYSLSTPWDVSTATYLHNFSVVSEESIPQDLRFTNDGMTMYMIGRASDKIHEYSLSTAWDVSTATYTNVSFSVVGQEANSSDFAFSSDGTKMYVTGVSSDRVHQYTLSTPWDISTASYDNLNLYVNGQDANPQSIAFKDDGTIMYMIGNSSDAVHQYELTTAWDISTAIYEQNVLISAQEATPTGVAFSNDGYKMYIIGTTSDKVHQYSLSLPWSPITATYDSVSLSVSAQDSTPQSITFNDDGTLLFMLGATSDTIYRYTLDTAWDISTASYVENINISAQELTPSEVTFSTDGTKMYVIGTTGDDVNEYNLSIAWKISTATYIQSFSISAQEVAPYGITFSTDGTNMYIIGSSCKVYQYSLTTAWDISTANYSNTSFSVLAQDTSPQSIFFSDAGTSLFMLGLGTDRVHQYSLDTAWDVSSAYYSQELNVSPQDSVPTGIAFSTDGSKLYILGDAGNDVNEYDLADSWRVNTATYVRNFSVNTEEATPSGITFKPDGTKMYLVGTTTDSVYQYSLTTPWDISTAAYDNKNFNLANQEAIPTGITLSDDGTKMFITGSSSGLDSVHQYTLRTAWDISTAVGFSHYVGNEDSVPSGVAFKTDGTKMYIVGQTLDSVYQYSLSRPWELGAVTYDNVSFSVFAQDDKPENITFKPDGTTMYIVGSTTDRVYSYGLSD